MSSFQQASFFGEKKLCYVAHLFIRFVVYILGFSMIAIKLINSGLPANNNNSQVAQRFFLMSSLTK